MKTKQARNIHAKRRLEERYGLNINRWQLRDMNLQIQSGKAQFIERQSNSRTVWRVQHEGRELFAVYHSGTNSIVTFLMPEWVLGVS